MTDPDTVVHVSVHRGDGETVGDDGDRRTFTLYRPEGLCDRAAEAGLAVESVGTDGEWVQLFARA